MPILSVQRESLFSLIGRQYTDDEFSDLCDALGLELDDVTSERQRRRLEFAAKGGKGIDEKALAAFSDDVLYKIDVPPNRWDLLCAEGFAAAVRVFNGVDAPLKLTVTAPKLTINVGANVAAVRPYVVGAVLRNITFDQAAYDSFIDHQERLHGNICRKRRLVSVGTHDLDTIKGPFRYDAVDPATHSFVPLNRESTVTLAELPAFIRQEPNMRNLVEYLPMIETAPGVAAASVPVVLDADGVVCSVPPIINGRHSQVSLATKNILIEATCEDRARAHVVIAQMVAAFGRYCDPPYHVEPVFVEYDSAHAARETVTPPPLGDAVKLAGEIAAAVANAVGPAATIPVSTIEVAAETIAALAAGGVGRDVGPDVYPRRLEVESAWVAGLVGVNSEAADQVSSLRRMGLGAVTDASGKHLTVDVPCTRPDVLHAVDLVEDVAIGIGYEVIGETAAVPQCGTTGKQQPLNKLADLVRVETASAGFTEVLTFSLMSVFHATAAMRWAPTLPAGATGPAGCTVDAAALNVWPEVGAPVLSSGKEHSAAMRASLIPSALLAARDNKSEPLPHRLFEVSDVVVRDAAHPSGARNVRRVCGLFTSRESAGYEIVKGLADLLLHKLADAQAVTTASLNADAAAAAAGEVRPPAGAAAVTFEPSDENPAFFPRRAARIIYRGQRIGWIGTIHPEVLSNFSLATPVSVFEFDLLPFL